MVTEIRASTLSRIMECLGPVTLQTLAENVTGEAAREGTACGELLSAMILQRNEKPNIGRNASNGVYIDSDMWFYARDVYRDLVANAQGAEITTEQRTDWMTAAGILMRGQYDISYRIGSVLYVEDLKYGFGIVEVEKNWQLISYAIGIAIRSQGLTHVQFTIHQPRAYHEGGPTRRITYTIEQLMEFARQIDTRAGELVAGVKTLSTGKHCKYCLGINTCPALIRATGNAIDVVMEDWNERELQGKDISQMLASFERAADLIKIKHESLKNLAIMKLQSNQDIPGYSYKQKFGDRAWKEGVSADSLKALSGGINVLEEPKLMSPSKAEKAGVSKKLVAQLIYKPMTGVDLIKSDTLKEAQQVFQKPAGV